MQLPEFQCHKRVRAAKILEIGHDGESPFLNLEGEPQQVGETLQFPSFGVTQAWLERFKPEVGGYYVVYEDGYASFSPAAAFEGGYTRVAEVAVSFRTQGERPAIEPGDLGVLR